MLSGMSSSRRQIMKGINARSFTIALVLLLGVASFGLGFIACKYGIFPIRLRSLTDRSIRQHGPSHLPVDGVRFAEVRGGASVGADKRFSDLAAVPYLRGYERAPMRKNVSLYNEELAFHGVNLYVSAHASEAFLADMNGRILHKWQYDYRRFRRDFGVTDEQDRYSRQARSEDQDYLWRRVHLFENGHILAMYVDIALIELDRQSNVVWTYFNRCHHDVDVDDEGRMYVLTRKASLVPQINRTMEVLEDFVTVLGPDGTEEESVSIVRCFLNSDYAPFLDKMPARHGDILHTNTLEVFDGTMEHRSALFRRGNVLISMSIIDTVAIIDLEAEKVLWALRGPWKGQHQPVLLHNGNMLIFDNLGYRGKSKVIEFEPFTQEIVWRYEGGADDEFFSEITGSCQRLPNGNTLITESTAGRAFEVTRDGEVVWEFWNPHRAGENDKLIARLDEVIRFRQDHCSAWLATGEDEN
jgi:hypothetical protein